MAVTPGFVVTQASTLLLVVLGAFVLVVRPRSRANVAFATYAVGTGVGVFLANLGGSAFNFEGRFLVVAALLLASAAALVVLVLEFPRRATARARAAIVGGVIIGLASYFMLDGGVSRVFGGFGGIGAVFVAIGVANVHLALRYGSEADASTRSQLALMAAGTLPFLAVGTGDEIIVGIRPRTWVFLALLAAVAGLWLRNIAAVPAKGYVARNVALLVPATVLLAMTASAVNTTGIDDTGIYGVSRVIAFAVLSYAIVRHRLLGIDVKIRFAISKSTIAAVFIAVFFIASETAQQFFGETLGSTYVGIAAAGALVFAMAPLQRAAERLAEKAVPSSDGAAPSRSLPASAVAFRSAVRVARHDGAITPEEDRHLAEVADALGLTHAEAARVRREVEEEVPQ